MEENDPNWIYIQLNSNDSSIHSYDNPGSFSNQLPYPIKLDENLEWEACMISCLFENCQTMPQFCYFQPIWPNPPTAVPGPDTPGGPVKSVYLNCSLCSSSIIGSQQTSVLCFIPSTVIINNGCYNFTNITTRNRQVFYTPYSERVWQPIGMKYFTRVAVSFTLSTGDLMPYNPNYVSTIVIAIRQKK